MSVQELATSTDIMLRLLGPFEAVVGRRQVALGGQRQRAVLARLALSGGSVVPVERLIDELWDGSPPPSALNTIQSYVSNLRRAFVDAGPLVERVGPGYRIALTPEQVDLHRFTSAVDEAGRAGVDPARQVELLDDALALWRGPALADFADDEWARADIVRLEELRLTAMEARFESLIGGGRHAGIVGELEQAVRDHPLRERFCGQLMLALYRSGRQADGLRAYERTRTFLSEEVGLDPGPDLQRIAGAILEHDAWLREPTTSVTPTTVTGPAVLAPPTTPPLALSPLALTAGPCRLLDDHRTGRPFVGRSDALGALAERWAAVEAGEESSAVIVSGEAGIGKTRLVQRFARDVEDRGGVVLWGRCTTDTGVVYQPIVHALLGAVAEADAGLVSAAVQARPGLAPLLPNVGRGEGTMRAADRLEVYEAAAELVRALGGGAPTLLVIDDAQWSDAASLHLLERILGHHLTDRLLVVATVRRPAGRPTPDLDRVVSSLRRDDRGTCLDLVGITAEEVRVLLDSIGGGGDQADAVHDRTGGNPFFVEQVAHAGAADDSVPATVRELLEARVADLGDETRSVLLAAAVLGARAELDVLATMTGHDIGTLLDITDRATAAGLLVEDHAIGWVAFPHALVRQSLLGAATRNRLAQLHLRAAAALGQRGTHTSTVTAVANHLLSADGLVPPARRARAGLDAAAGAIAAMAPEVTVGWLDRVRPLLDEVDEGPELVTMRYEVHLLAAAARRHLGDRPASSAEAWAAVDQARRLEEPVLLALATDAVALAVAGVGFDIGVVDEELLALVEEALTAIGPEPSASRAMLLAWSAAARTGLDDPRRDLHADEAIRMSRLVGDPAVEARAGLARRLAAAGPLRLDERFAHRDAALEAAIAAGDVEVEIVNLVFDVVELLEGGQTDASQAALEHLRARIAPLARPSANAYLHFLDASAALLRGDLVLAEAAGAAGLACGELAHGGNAVQAWAGQQFLLAWCRGELGALSPMVAQITEERPSVPIWRVALAGTLVAAGDPAAGRLCRELGADAGDQYTGDSQWGVAMATLAEVAWSVDDAETAAVVAELLAPIEGHVAVTAMGAVSVGHVHRARGLALAARGDIDGGLEALDTAVRASRQAGFHTWLARALHDRGAILSRRGRRGDAAASARSCEEAAVLARSLGLKLTLAPGD